MEAGEMHGEVSLTQGKLSGSLGKAGELWELGFFSANGCVAGRRWVHHFDHEKLARRTVIGGHHQVGGDSE